MSKDKPEPAPHTCDNQGPIVDGHGRIHATCSVCGKPRGGWIR